MNNTLAGTVNIIGNVTGSAAGATIWGVANRATGTINITGTVTGGGKLPRPTGPTT